MAIQNRAGLYIYQIWLPAPSSVLFSQRRPRRELVCKNDRAQFWQNATRLLPVSHLYSIVFCHNWPRSYYAKPAWIQFGFGWLCLIWAKQIQPGSKTVCIIGPTSGPRWIGSSMFTGSKAECQQSALWLACQCWDHLSDTSCHGHQHPCVDQCEWHGKGLFASDTTGSFSESIFKMVLNSTSSCTCYEAHLHKAPLHILVDRLADKSSRSILREHFQDSIKLNSFIHLFWSSSPQSALTHFGWQTGR